MTKYLFLACYIWIAPLYAQSVLPAPQLISPEKQKVIAILAYFPELLNIPIEFKWEKVSESNQYRFQMHKDSLSFKTLIVDRITSDTQITLDSLYHKSKVFRYSAFSTWRVKSINTITNLESDWSETRSIFLAMAISNENEAPKTHEIQAPYPNPFSNQLSIPIQISKPTSVQIDLYDLLGRHITTIYQAILQQNITIEWIPKHLPASSYLLAIKSDFSINTFIISHHH